MRAEILGQLAEWGALRHPAHSEAAAQLAHAFRDRAAALCALSAGQPKFEDGRAAAHVLRMADQTIKQVLATLKLWPSPPPPPAPAAPAETF